MTWEDRKCPSCGTRPTRWDPSSEPVTGVVAFEMEEPHAFRCDGCGAEWISDTAGEGGDGA